MYMFMIIKIIIVKYGFKIWGFDVREWVVMVLWKKLNFFGVFECRYGECMMIN